MGHDRIATIEIRGLGDLIEHVTPKTPDPHSDRLRDYAVYRGMRHAHQDE